MKKFAENLKELKGNRSVNKLAKEIGMPAQTLSRYINCTREVSLAYLCKIADFFDEDIDVLLGRREY